MDNFAWKIGKDVQCIIWSNTSVSEIGVCALVKFTRKRPPKVDAVGTPEVGLPLIRSREAGEPWWVTRELVIQHFMYSLPICLCFKAALSYVDDEAHGSACSDQ